MLDLTKQTLETCSRNLTNKYNSLRSSIKSVAHPLKSCCPYPKSKQLKNNINSSLDQTKNQQSLHLGDFESHSACSFYSSPKSQFNVFPFKIHAYSPNKSAITAAATTIDTFCTENPSLSCLDIPSERMHHKIVTTYEGYQEHIKDIVKTEDSDRKTFSFKSGRRSYSAHVRSRAASRYKDCSPDSKTKEFNTSNSCLLNRGGSKDTSITNFQNRIDFDEELKISPLITPKLGSKNSTINFPGLTRKEFSTINRSKKERSLVINGEDFARDPIKELKIVREEITLEKEALKTRVAQLKKKIKDEETRKHEVMVTTKMLEDVSQRMKQRSKKYEKKFFAAKTQILLLRKDIIRLLQENDEEKIEISLIQDKIRIECQIALDLKNHIKISKIILADDNKEKEKIKEELEKDKRTFVKLDHLCQSLTKEKEKYIMFLEEKYLKAKRMK